MSSESELGCKLAQLDRELRSVIEDIWKKTHADFKSLKEHYETELKGYGESSQRA